MLKSQQVRSLSPEMDPLRMGMGWTVDDLSKPQIMVESTYGNSHPGSGHLNIFVEEAVRGVNDHGGKAARYFATDMCDGMAQGHDGINYSLAHREAITNLVEAQANATTFDGGVFISSCDKAMPAMLMSIGRMKDMMAAIVVTGGVMEAHDLPAKYTENDPGCAINELLTLEQIGKFSAQYERGEIPAEQLTYYKQHACPSCGACSFMGTASTMQVMAEALGLMLPGTALMPATAPELKQAAYDAGAQLMKLVEAGVTAGDIVDMRSFENAIMVHAAISGSTNALMHIPAIAHEFGFEIDADTLEFLTTPMKQEVKRCKMAFEEAMKGKKVAMICSGDAGVYGMAGLMYEVGVEFPKAELEIVPGITAAIGGAAVLGAPLIHDFAVISLSDLLTPWEKIEKRVRAAAMADFVICLYNPSSRKRHDYLEKACNMMLEYKAEDTICGIVRQIGRDGQESRILTLKELKDTEVDMFTTVFIGNEQTQEMDGHMVTPRGYRDV